MSAAVAVATLTNHNPVVLTLMVNLAYRHIAFSTHLKYGTPFIFKQRPVNRADKPNEDLTDSTSEYACSLQFSSKK